MNASRVIAAMCVAMSLSAVDARAQGSAVIDGVADAYVQSLRGSTRLERLQSGGLSGSRLGVRGQDILKGP